MTIVAMGGLLSSNVQARTPQVNFQLQCMGCHGIDGAGESGRVPSLRRTLVAWSAIPDGRDFILRVPGVAQAPLSDRELADLLNWMARNLSENPVPRNFVGYSEAEVARTRHRPLSAVAPMRERLLREVQTP